VSKTFCGGVLMDMVAKGQLTLGTRVREIIDADGSELADVSEGSPARASRWHGRGSTRPPWYAENAKMPAATATPPHKMPKPQNSTTDERRCTADRQP
jgi:hypothetical protein